MQTRFLFQQNATHSMKLYIFQIAFVAARIACAPLPATAAEQSQSLPNILFILADDK